MVNAAFPVKPIVDGIAPVDMMPYTIASGNGIVVDPVPININVGSAALPTVAVLSTARPTLVTADMEPDVPTKYPEDNPPLSMTLTTVGAAVPRVTADEFILTAVMAPTKLEAVMPDTAINPPEDKTDALVGPAEKAVSVIALVEDVNRWVYAEV